MPLVAQGPDYPSPDLSPDAILEKAGSVADMRYEGAKAAKALASLMGHPRWASLLTVAALRTTVPQSLADVRQVAPGRNRLQDHFDAGPPASTDLQPCPQSLTTRNIAVCVHYNLSLHPCMRCVCCH